MANGNQTQQPLNYQQRSDIEFLLKMIGESGQPTEKIPTNQPIDKLEIPNLSLQDFKKLFEKSDDSWFLGYEGAVSDKLKELYPHLVTVPFAPGRDIIAVKNPETQEVREFNLGEINLKTQEGLNEMQSIYEEIAAFVGSTSEEFKNTTEGKIYELTGIHNEDDYGLLSKPKESENQPIEGVNVIGGIQTWDTKNTLDQKKLNAEQQLDLSYKIISKLKDVIKDPSIGIPNFGKDLTNIESYEFSPDEINEAQNHVYREIIKIPEYKNLTKESFEKIMKNEQLFRATQAKVRDEIEREKHHISMKEYYKDGELDDSILNDKILNEFILAKSDNSVKVEWDKIPETPLGNIEGDGKEYNMRTAIKTIAANSTRLEEMYEDLRDLQEDPEANSEKIQELTNGIDKLNEVDNKVRNLIGKENLEKYIGDYFNTTGYTDEMIKKYNEFQGTVSSLVEEQISNNPQWSPRDALKALLTFNVTEAETLDSRANEKKFTFNLTDDITEQTFKKILLARGGVRYGEGLRTWIKDTFKEDWESKIDGDTATLSYGDLNKMGLDYKDFNNWVDPLSHLVSEEDVNWMRVHSNAKSENDVERSVLFNQSILNKSVLSYEKPEGFGLFTNVGASAVKTIATEWFGINPLDADKLVSDPKSYARGEDGKMHHTGRFLIDKTQEAIAKYNSVNSEKIKNGTLQAIELSDEEIEYVARSSGELYSDQIGAFMPILAQLGAISVATEGIGTIPQIARSLRSWRALSKKSMLAKASWHVGAGILEEAKMQFAGFKPGAGISFYGIGLAASPLKLSRLIPMKSSFVKTLDPAFETLFKTGPIGAVAMKTAGVTEAMIDAWYFKDSDLDTSLDEMFGNHEDLIQQSILDVLTFKTIGVAKYASPFSGAGKIRQELIYPFYGNQRMNRLIKDMKAERDGVFEEYEKYGKDGKKFEDLSKAEQIELIANRFNLQVGVGEGGIPKGKKLHDIDPNTQRPYGWKLLNRKQKTIWETKNDIAHHAEMFKLTRNLYKKLQPPKDWDKATEVEQKEFKDNVNKHYFDPMKRILKEYGERGNLKGKDLKSLDFNVEFTTDRRKFEKDPDGKDLKNTAEFDPATNTMRFDPNLYTPGKPIHEFLHKALSSYLNADGNQLVKANFHGNLKNFFEGQDFRHLETGELISDLILNTYKEGGKKLDLRKTKDRQMFNEEYFAHILEQMANPEFYYKHTAPTIIRELKQDFRSMMEEGIFGGRLKWKYEPPRTAKDMVQLMGRLSYGLATGRAVDVKLKTLTELDRISLLDVELNKSPKGKSRQGSIDLSTGYKQASEKLAKEYKEYGLDNMKKDSKEKQRMSEVLSLDWEVAIQNKIKRMLPNSSRIDVERIANQFITSSSWGTGKRGLPDLINEYSKDLGYGIEKWIGKLYEKRLLEHTRDQVFTKSIDVEPGSGRSISETLAGGQSTPVDIKTATTPKPKSNLLTNNLTVNDKKLIGNKKKEIIKNSILDLTPKEIPGLIEGISKPAPKPILKLVNEITGKNVQENKDFVNENFKESKAALPPFNNGIGGKSIGVPPVMLKAFYKPIKGTASGKDRGAGRKSGDAAGNPWQELRTDITKKEMFDFFKFDKGPGETGYTTGRTRWTAFKKFLAKKILNQELEMMEKNGKLPSEISNELTKNNIIAEIVSTNQKRLGSRDLTIAALEMKMEKDPTDWVRKLAKLTQGTAGDRKLLSREVMKVLNMEWGETAKELTDQQKLRAEVKAVAELQAIAKRLGIDARTSSYSEINKDPDLQIERKKFDLDILSNFVKESGFSFGALTKNARSIITITLGANARTRTERINGVDVKLRSSDVKEGSTYWQGKEAKEIFSEKDITKQEREQALKDYGAVYRIDYQNVRKKVSDFIKQQDKSTKSIGEKNIELKDFVRDLMTSKRNLKPGTPAIKNADGTIKVDEVKPRRYTVEETLAANKLLAKRWILSVYKAAQKGNRLGYALAHQGMQTDIRDGIFKALAYPLRSVANRGSKPTKKNKYQEYHWEHERQLLNNTNLITEAIKTHLKDKTSAKFKAKLDQILETSHQSLIPKDLQMKNDKSGKTTFSDLYGKDGKITINDNSLYNVFLNAKDANAQVILHGKYAGKTVYEMVTSESPNSLQYKVLKKILKDKGKKLDVTVYDKLQEIISEGKVKTVNRKLANKLDGIFASKDLSNVELTDLIRKRAEAIAKMRDLNAKHKGASVLDFDETVAFTKSKVIVNLPKQMVGGKQYGWETWDKGRVKMTSNAKEKITPAEFAKNAEGYESIGATFDFSEFNKVIGGKKGPLFKKLQNIQEKYGTKNTFILTARPPEAAPAIKRFLKELGIDIPLENIVGLKSGAPGAKANFFVEKTAEGYNDFYFVDDMLKNVNAVKKTLKILGVDGKVRQAKIQASKDLNGEFNKMLEQTTGVERFKVFSTGAAKSRGAKIGNWKWWLPPSAGGFLDLMYPTFGKGKTGDAHMKWFDKNLGRPYARGFYELNKAKQRVHDDMQALKKRYTDIKKIMNKSSGYNHFTNDAAVRVYLWNKHKFDIPDLSKTDVKQLVKLVKSNPRLESYANQISKITQLKEGYVKPTENWLTKSVQHDLIEVSENVGRKEFFKEWVENKNQIFTKENLNKLESQFGTEYRKALEDVLYRMENGQNKPKDTTKVEAWYNKWIANATGTVMFLNRRSALTQTISMVNFLNWKDNNPLAAARAFTNQPRFWKDFSMIWNSPMLKQRRKGLSMDVNYAEIVNTVSGKKDKVSAAVAYMLNKGFTLTKVADNFAIAFGGASFYRNRLNSYLRQGMKEAEAKKKAFLDFQEVSEPTQQSSRPDLISQQQASPLGRFLLTFQNVTMQNNRNGKRAFLDLKNNRGDFKTNISKMIYYFGVQNAIFLGMQQALFAAYWDDDAEETDITKKHIKIGNGLLDALLRGSGMYGAGIATIKNTIWKYFEERQKGWKGSEAKVLIEALNLSPPIGSKARKLHSAMLDAKYNKDSVLKPVLLATEGATNVPFHEFYEMVQDGVHLSSKNLEDWQKVAIALGYPEWQVNYKPPKKKEKKKPKITYTISPY